MEDADGGGKAQQWPCMCYQADEKIPPECMRQQQAAGPDPSDPIVQERGLEHLPSGHTYY